MTSTLPAAPVAPTAPLNGAKRSPAGVPAAPRRPRNTLWMVAGVLLVVVSGVAAATAVSSLDDRVDVLVAARTIAEGEVVVSGDLRTVSIGVDSRIRAVPPDEAGQLVGQVATGPVGEGSIIHPSQFVAGDSEDQPKVIVGAALEAGQYPLTGLRPGDRVKVIEVSGPNAVFDESSTLGPRELAEGEIVEVAPTASTDVLLVSIRINEAIAASLAERAQQGRLRLVLIDNGLLDDPVSPLDPADPAAPGSPSEVGQ